jgi:HAD superfamily hydrolase (TIGR01509 family)
MADPSGLRAALLDFDQTLVDLPVDWEGLRKEIAAVFRARGISTTMRPMLRGMRQAFKDLDASGYSPAQRGAIRRRINSLLTEYEMAAVPRAEAMPGARELMQALRARGVKVIIQSSNSVRAIQQTLERLTFPVADAVIGRESARRVKPDPQGVRRVLRQLGIRGTESAVIGDGDFDVELGRAIGATTVRLGRGNERADYHLNSLLEAPPLLLGKAAA